jgi:predicted Zn-dependent protease
MKALNPPDSLCLESAKGWYLLGNLKEADAELDRLPAELQNHPDVLEVRFAVYSRSRKWSDCMQIATAMLGAAPERPTSWINSAIVLHALNETHAAWNTLHQVMDRFPKVPLIPYNMACYACHLGRYVDSCEMLEKAINVGGNEMMSLAREDPDLKPLWVQIEREP